MSEQEVKNTSAPIAEEMDSRPMTEAESAEKRKQMQAENPNVTQEDPMVHIAYFIVNKDQIDNLNEILALIPNKVARQGAVEVMQKALVPVTHEQIQAQYEEKQTEKSQNKEE